MTARVLPRRGTVGCWLQKLRPKISNFGSQSTPKAGGRKHTGHTTGGVHTHGGTARTHFKKRSSPKGNCDLQIRHIVKQAAGTYRARTGRSPPQSAHGNVQWQRSPRRGTAGQPRFEGTNRRHSYHSGRSPIIFACRRRSSPRGNCSSIALCWVFAHWETTLITHAHGGRSHPMGEQLPMQHRRAGS